MRPDHAMLSVWLHVDSQPVRGGRSAPAGGAGAPRGSKMIRFLYGRFSVSTVARIVELGELLGRRTISSFCFCFQTFGLFLVVSVSGREFSSPCPCFRLVCVESFLLSFLFRGQGHCNIALYLFACLFSFCAPRAGGGGRVGG